MQSPVAWLAVARSENVRLPDFVSIFTTLLPTLVLWSARCRSSVFRRLHFEVCDSTATEGKIVNNKIRFKLINATDSNSSLVSTLV